MSLFGSIMSKIFHHPSASGPEAVEQAPPIATDTTTQQPVADAVAPAPGGTPFNVGAALAAMALKNGQTLNYKTSIVDLLKLLDLNSSIEARKELAAELHYTGDMQDSAHMNVWLHKEIMNKLEENGGTVPADLKGG